MLTTLSLNHRRECWVGGLFDGVSPLHIIGNSSIDHNGVISVASDVTVGAGILLEANARAIFNGGSITVRNVPTRPLLFDLNNETFARISGGSYVVLENNVPVTPLIDLDEFSQLRIWGRDFNYPRGFVFDMSGVVTGTLYDGQEFRFAFSREEKAFLLLVPEPSSGILASICVAAIAFARQRKQIIQDSAPKSVLPLEFP
jgi:hypothetical protein